MWSKIFKLLINLLPYVPGIVNWILKRFKIKKFEVMEEKIKKVAQIIDDEIDFKAISRNIKNIFVRGLVASVELFDGKIFNIALRELINQVPEDKHWIVDAYLDAVISRDWAMVTDTTADVINVFVDIPGATEEQEKEAYASVLVLILMFVKSKAGKKN